jgi:sugar lactone lactonase YvrE
LFNRSELHHIAPSGQPIQVIDLPVQQPTSVMFGGHDLGTLFITTARMHLSPAQLQNQPWAGHVLCFEPGVKGLPEPRCAF